MPIYDYLCSNCGQKTEFIHGINAPAPRFCPACGAEGTLRKTFATPAVHFKGSGWAKKDRSSSSGRAKTGATSSSSDSTDGTQAGKGSSADSKTAASESTTKTSSTSED
jgi:putative FmdB family regulatory protein